MKLTLLSLLILVGCVSSAFSAVKRDDGLVVNNESLTLEADSVNEINSKTKLFKTRHYSKFEGKDLSQFVGLNSPEAEAASAKKRPPRAISNDETSTQSTVVPPAFFDVSEQWPQCKKVFEAIQDQGPCDLSYAIAVTSSISDRRCIRYNGTAGARISAWDLAWCCEECKIYKNNSCLGGFYAESFDYYVKTGIVTGGPYQGGGCKPYELAPNATNPPNPMTACSTTCQPSYTVNTYANDKKKGLVVDYVYLNTTVVQQEIMARGSVVSRMAIYQDFYQYSSGIYHHPKQNISESSIGMLNVKIVGWGEENGVKYWKLANSWGSDWGENGFFRILRDTNECNVEMFVVWAKALKD